jgi:HAD superfamily hydrolase (TIGR01509 family)
MKNIRALIFDCDGVMFDSRQSNISFYNHLLDHFDLPPMTDSMIAYVHMHTAGDSIRHIFHGTPFLTQAFDYARDMDYTPFIHKMILEPGLKELLQRFKGRLGLAVATNRSTTIGNVLKIHGLESYFDLVVSSLDVQQPKPHPESLLKILEYFQILPSASIYVGDSLVDSQTAHAAAVPFIAYKNGLLEADYHVDRMEDIAALLNGR